MAFFVAWTAGCAELYDVEEEEESRPTSRQWISRVSPQRIWGMLDAISFFVACWLVAIYKPKKIPNIENPTKIENQGFFSCSKNSPSLHIYILIHFYISTINPSSLKQLLPLLIFKMKCYIEGSIYSLVCLLPFFMECRKYFYNFQGISKVFQG